MKTKQTPIFAMALTASAALFGSASPTASQDSDWFVVPTIRFGNYTMLPLPGRWQFAGQFFASTDMGKINIECGVTPDSKLTDTFMRLTLNQKIGRPFRIERIEDMLIATVPESVSMERTKPSTHRLQVLKGEVAHAKICAADPKHPGQIMDCKNAEPFVSPAAMRTAAGELTKYCTQLYNQWRERVTPIAPNAGRDQQRAIFLQGLAEKLDQLRH